MFDLINWLMLMCCWCCDRKDRDEEEYDISERKRERGSRANSREQDGDATAGEQGQVVKKKPLLAHAPQLEA
ncbi:uncharacterized protein A1O5_05662 [Cladophialophora psammophila CBS 110553]|uniref:Uncharacterized protein n=1 Tax=Cladophialophora psammophila CBS 110553 TaxID=1182543 RepID=W9WR30_9EURO|nr:uncharacterized protein A1O5_05662 [Cladophialophora psammophila CBS 110553]EXJ70672.1 hypothetical protein A1O5_05662 [Cladophialophora psammophila CBS 110553]